MSSTFGVQVRPTQYSRVLPAPTGRNCGCAHHKTGLTPLLCQPDVGAAPAPLSRGGRRFFLSSSKERPPAADEIPLQRRICAGRGAVLCPLKQPFQRRFPAIRRQIANRCGPNAQVIAQTVYLAHQQMPTRRQSFDRNQAVCLSARWHRHNIHRADGGNRISSEPLEVDPFITRRQPTQVGFIFAGAINMQFDVRPLAFAQRLD